MELTSSLTGLRKNSNNSSDSKPQLELKRRTSTLSQTKETPQSTGLLRDSLPQLRTKECADHAGHSLPSEPSNQDGLLTNKLQRTSNNGQSKNSLTAQEPMETTDAMEDG